jgi:hypothetical protein
MRLPQTQIGIHGVLDSSDAIGLESDLSLEYGDPELMVSGNEMIQVFVNHLKEYQGPGMTVKKPKHNFPGKIL